ncbi:hypothetical protein F9348_00250 [Escherichia coli]|nr:hypothetical protein [Escherichia coli]EFN8586831.1 hypothetical protein [Escherichia coli O53:H10]
MKICIDDGSTNIKLAWTENGERRNAISPNSFKSEWSAPFGGTQPANYMLDGVRYGFDPVSDRFVQTTDTQYQYSDVNVIAIHHALVKSGITPQEVDVVVTLPLSEYFDTNAQPDMANINRKKANVMRPVEYQNGKAFTIRNVRVMPESIPAGFKALADMSPFESLLIVDLGGTTLDVAKVQGQLAGISQVFCDPHVGVSLMADAVLSVMATNGMRTRPVADRLTVQSARIVTWRLNAKLYFYPGPESEPILAAAESSFRKWLSEQGLIGQDVALSAIAAALHVHGVQRVEIIEPTQNMAISDIQAARCESFTISEGGRNE